MSKQTIIGIIALIVIIGGGYVLFTKSPVQAPATEIEKVATSTVPAVTEETPQAPAETVKTLTLAEVATHNTAASCWAAIAGSVYDLTGWIKNHPGGEKAILSLCGTDGTVAFEKQHGGKEKQEKQLATFKIGTLAK